MVDVEKLCRIEHAWQLCALNRQALGAATSCYDDVVGCILLAVHLDSLGIDKARESLDLSNAWGTH